MPELQVLNTLSSKRQEIEAHILSLERDLEQARRDLSAIVAAAKVFSADGPKITAYMNFGRLLPRHELPRLAMEALQASPDGMSTTAIASHVLTVKGLDGADRHLRTAMALKLVHLLRQWERRKRVVRIGRNRNAIVWRLTAPSATEPHRQSESETCHD